MPLIVALALAWAAGLWLAEQLNQPAWLWLLWTALAAGALAGLRREARWRLPLAGLLVLGLAAARYEAARPPFEDPGFLATYNALSEGTVTVEGVVADTPAAGETRAELRLRAEALYLPGADHPLPVRGLLAVYAPRFSAGRLAAAGSADYEYGDRLAVTGPLAAPPIFDGFDFRAYLARHGVHSVLAARQVVFVAARQADPFSQALFDLRAHGLRTTRRLFPQPHAELLAGILLGDESGIPNDVAEAFAATGTSHLIAISGFNIAILAAALTAVTFRLWGRWRGLLVTVALLAAYSALAGGSASVVRAALMGSAALLAHQLGRRTDALNTLAATVIIMTAFNPHWLWDVGFQLSALATLGLVLYATPWRSQLERALGRTTTSTQARRLAALATELVLLTVAAQLTTLPLTLLYFQRFSLSALPANVLVLPAQPALMLASGLAVLLGMLWLPLGQLAAWLAWPFSAYTLGVVEAFAALPGGSFYLGEVAPALVVGLYALLFGVTWLAARPSAQRPAWWRDSLAPRLPAGGLLALFSATVLAWSYALGLPAGGARLTVTMLDVGAGEAVLIRAPGGATALIGGGAGGRTLTRALGEHLPLGTSVLDVVVMASPAEGHIGAWPDLLARYRVERAVLTGAEGRGATYRAALQRLYAQPGLTLLEAAALPALDLGDGVRLRVLADGPEGSTLRLDWMRFSLLLPIGLDGEGAARLLASAQAAPATALLLGRDETMSPEWLAALDPRLVLISTEAGRGYPDAETLERLAGRAVLRTDVNGSVTVETDGTQLWVRAER